MDKILIIISLGFLVFKGLNYGVDFKGGTLIEIRVETEKPDIEVLRTSFNKMNLGKISIKNFWIVRQFNNEYNPIHYHDGHISGVGYLKIPKFFSKGYKKSKIDGTIDFINGNKMFLSDSIYNHQPKEGDVILFPHYLMHTAYPFKSSGERRSFSFNLEIDKKIANVFSR